MERKVAACKVGLVMVLGVVFLAAQGCTVEQGCAAVSRYFQYRYHDFTQMVDGGLTFTPEPCIGLYWNSLDLLVAGYCNIDGYFFGWGGNQIGLTRVHSKCYGLGVSREEVGWGPDFDVEKPETMYIRYGGLAGLASIGGEGDARGTPDYTPACVHFIPHIGFVGLVWNARWTQIADFFLGWTTIDIDGDDGYVFGKWPWQERTKFETNVEGVEPEGGEGRAALRDSLQGRPGRLTHAEPVPMPDSVVGPAPTVSQRVPEGVPAGDAAIR